MKLKFCGCRMCREGRHRFKGMIKAVIRRARRKCREAIRRGDEPETKVSVPYTD